MTNTKYLTIAGRILQWLALVWFKNVPNSQKLVEIFILKIRISLLANGQLSTIRHFKVIRLLYTKYLSGEPLLVTEDIIGINKTGLPKTMRSFNDLIESRRPENIRFILTLLSITRLIPGWKDPDLSTITKMSKANKQTINEIGRFAPQFLRDAGIAPIKDWELNYTFDKVNYSTKAGPNGRASIMSLYDLAIMPPILNKLLKDMGGQTVMTYYENLLSSSRVIKAFTLIRNGIHPITKTVKSFDERVKLSLDKEMPKLLRKLSIVKDPEGKSRIIAIFDFWSQNILLLLHNKVFEILRSLPNDRTFTQDPVIKSKPEGHKYYSYDLSAATDRFPIELQEILVSSLVNPDYALRWRMVLTSQGFHVPWTNEVVNYNAGQPMGAYSSWAIFTLSHHLVLHYIHFKLGLNKFYYQILGDDIVIYHDKVAEEYAYYMKSLDVELSPFKSHISENMYEFAKRWFISGIEVTGIQLKGLSTSYNKYHLLHEIINSLFEKGLNPREYFTIPNLVISLMKHMNLLCHKRQENNMLHRVKLLHAFRKYTEKSEVEPLIQYMKEIFPHYSGQLNLNEYSENYNIRVNSIFYNAMNEVNQKTTAEYLNFAQDLLKSNKILEPFTVGIASESDLWTSPIYYLANSPIMGGLINKIDSIRKVQNNCDSISEFVKVAALPDPTNIFDKRNATLLLGATAKIAKKFKAMFSEMVIQERPIMPSENLGGTIFHVITTDLRNLKKDKLNGLGVKESKPKPAPVEQSDNPFQGW